MKIVTAVFADFRESFLGGPSVLLEPLAGRPVIEHTLSRARSIAGADQCLLIVQPRDEAVARNALAACAPGGIELLAIDDGVRPRRRLIRAARKWGLRGWRGTPLATTVFDEFVEPLLVARVLDHCAAHAVLAFDAAHAALDPAIAAAMLAHARENQAEAPFVFTQSPPGLAGIVLGREIIRDSLQQNLTIGLQYAYRPESPRMDIVTKPMCCRVPLAVMQCAERFIPDTRAASARLERAFAELGPHAHAEQLCDWSRRQPRRTGIPREIEIELTTDDPLPQTTLRPRGSRVPRRRLTDPAALQRIAGELAALDDRLVVFGGHGDPLAHPDFAECLRRVRQAGVCGIAVVTPLVELPDAACEALFEQRVEIVEVQLDAHSADAYRLVHGLDHLERVHTNIQRIQDLRRARLSPEPIVVPSLTRAATTLGELEAFYDHWVRTLGTAVVRPLRSFGGLIGSDSAIPLTAPVRTPCCRLEDRLVLLADGRATACNEDVTGSLVCGDWRSASLATLWESAQLLALCERHRTGEWAAVELCRGCVAWGDA